MHIKFIHILLFILSIELFGNSNIVDIDINQAIDRVQLEVKLDSEYLGVVVRKSGSSIQKIVLNGAIIDKRYSKNMRKDSIISKIDILPFPNRTDILFSSLYNIDINFYKSKDNKNIIITISEKVGNSANRIEPEGRSLFGDLSSGYITTLSILFILVIVLFFIRKKIESRIGFKFKKSEDSNSLNWLLDKDNRRISLKSIQVPDINFKTRKNPKTLNKLNSGLDDPLMKSVKREAKRPEKKEQQKENKTVSQSLPKPLKSSKNVEVIFDENIDRGRVFMLNIANKKYLFLENLNSTTTLLDKFETPNKNIKIKEKAEKKDKNKLVMPLVRKEVTIIEKDFDVKLPIEKTLKPEEKKDESSDLKDLFKDSRNLKI